MLRREKRGHEIHHDVEAGIGYQARDSPYIAQTRAFRPVRGAFRRVQ
jgi:hypothetical protein